LKRHWRWYTRNKSRHADRAVAEVISTILSVSIVLTVAATAVQKIHSPFASTILYSVEHPAIHRDA